MLCSHMYLWLWVRYGWKIPHFDFVVSDSSHAVKLIYGGLRHVSIFSGYKDDPLRDAYKAFDQISRNFTSRERLRFFSQIYDWDASWNLSTAFSAALQDCNPKKKDLSADIFQQMYAKICSENHQNKKRKCMSTFGESKRGRANQSPFSCSDVRLRMTREKKREREREMGEGSV